MICKQEKLKYGYTYWHKISLKVLYTLINIAKRKNTHYIEQHMTALRISGILCQNDGYLLFSAHGLFMITYWSKVSLKANRFHGIEYICVWKSMIDQQRALIIRFSTS